MKEISLNEFIKDGFTVANYSVSGFDLNLTTTNGDIFIIPNGLTNVLFDNIKLNGKNNAVITSDDIISSIPDAGKNYEKVFLKDMPNQPALETDIQEELKKRQELQKETSQLENKIETLDVELIQKNKEIQQKIDNLKQANKSLNEKNEELEALTKELEKNNEALKSVKRQVEKIEDIEQENKAYLQEIELMNVEMDNLDATKAASDTVQIAEKLKEQQEKLSDTPITPPNKNTSTETASSESDSSSPSAPVIEETESVPPMLFISGGLDSESDSGLGGDSITALSEPTFSGITLAGLTVQLTISGTVYSFQSDSVTGEWRFTLPQPISNGSYTYTLSVTGTNGDTVDTEKSLIIDSTQPELSNIIWQNDASKTPNIVNTPTPTLVGSSNPNTLINLVIDGKSFSTKTNNNGDWSLLIDTPLPEGVSDYTIISTTQAGNQIKDSGQVTVDTAVATSTFAMLDADDTGAKGDFITQTSNPTITGVTEPYASVVLSVNQRSLDPITADETGKWSINTGNLVAGKYNLLINITDQAGNTLQQSTDLQIIPELTNLSAHLAASSDTGISSSDNITKTTRPTLIGTTEPNTIITITAYGDTDVPVTVDETGAWSFPYPEALPDLTDGLFNYVLNAKDAAGNKATFNGSFTVDTSTSITAALSSFSATNPNDKTVTDQARPTLTGQTEKDALVSVVIDNETYPADVDEFGTWTFRLIKPVSQGVNNYTVEVEDLAGNKDSVTETFQYVPDGVVLPTITAELNPTSDSGIKGDGITNINRPIFSGSTEAGNIVSMTIAGRTFSSEASTTTNTTTSSNNIVVNEKGDFTVTFPTDFTLPNGINKYEITAKNPTTNLATTTEGTVLIDTTKPNLTVELDTNTGAQDDYCTQNQTNTFSGVTEIGSTLSVVFDGISRGNVNVGVDGSWSYTTPQMPVDPWKIKFTATDLAGNTSVFNNILVIDKTAPNASLEFLVLSPYYQSGAWKSNALIPEFTFGANLSDTSLPVTATYNGQTFNGTSGSVMTFPTVGSANRLIHTIFSFSISDCAGNTMNNSNLNIYFLNQSFDTTSAIIGEDSPENNNITANNRPSFSGHFNAVTDGTGYGIAINFAGTFNINGKKYPITLTKNNGVVNWAFTYPEDAPALTRGEQTYQIYIRDNYGNETTSDNFTFTLTTLTFDLTESTDTGIVGDFMTTNTAPELIGTSAAGASIRVLFNGQYYSVSPDDNGNWTFQFPSTPLEVGSYDFNVEELINGTVSNFSKTLIIESSAPPPAPTAELSQSAKLFGQEDITNLLEPELIGTGVPNGTVTITINDQAHIVDVDSDGNWNQTIPLSNGEYEYTLITTNIYGIDSQAVTNNLTVHNQSMFVVEYINGEPIDISQPISISKGIIQGKALPDSEVTIKRNDNVGVSTTADANGAWELNFDSIITLTQGNKYTLSVIATSNTYNATNRVSLRFVIDNDKPTITSELSTESQTGSDSSYTNKSDVSIVGTTSPNATVTITYNNISESVTADASTGDWQYTFPNQFESGEHTYTVTATDISMASTEPLLVTFTVDLLNPILSYEVNEAYDTNIKGDYISSSTTQEITGVLNADDTLKVYVNDVLQTPVMGDNGNWSVTLTNLTDGNYNFSVNVTNKAGTTSTQTGTIVIQTAISPPTVKLDKSTDSGDLDDNITNITTPAFSGTAQPNSIVTLTINGNDYTATTSSLGNWIIHITDALADNDYPYTVKAENLAGIISTVTSGTVTIKTTADTSSTVTASLANSSHVAGDTNTANSNTPTLEGTSSANAPMQLLVNKLVYTLQADASGNWAYTFTQPLPDGTIQYDIKALDSAGNTTGSTSGSFLVASVAPITLNGVEESDGTLNTAFLTNDTTPTLKGVTLPNSNISIDIENNTYPATSDASGNWSVDITNALTTNTPISFTVSVTSPTGLTSQKEGSLTVNTTPPTELSGGLSDTSLVEGTNNVTISNTPSFSGSTIALGKVSITINSDTLTTVADISGNWQVTYDAEPLTNGDHQYSISVKDTYGNVISSPITNSILVSIDKPTTSIDISSYTDTGQIGDMITLNTQPTLVGQTSPNASVIITIADMTSPANVDAAGNWTFLVPKALADGNYPITVLLTDQYGVQNTITSSLTISSSLPDAPNVVVEDSRDGVFVSDPTPTFSGSTQPNGAISFTINNRTYSVNANESGDWTLELPAYAALPAGSYSYTAKAMAPNGAVSGETSGSITVSHFTVQLSPDSNSGNPNDNITSNTSPTFIGTGEPKATVTITINNKNYDSTVNENGTWSIPITDTLTSTTWNYTATMVTQSGQTLSVNKSIVIDDIDPSVTTDVSGKALSEGETVIINSKTPVISGTTDPFAIVQLKLGDQDDSVSASENGEWSYSVPSALLFSNNNLSLNITITDLAGKTNTLNGTLSVLQVSLAPESDTGVQGDNITSLTSVTLTGETLANADVEITVGSATPAKTTTASDGTWSLTLNNLSEGSNGYVLTVMDTGSSTPLTTYNGSITVDTTPPSITGDLSTTDDPDDNDITQETQPTFTGTVEIGSTVAVTIDTSTQENATVDSQGNWTLTWPTSLSNGDYNVSVIATDIAGVTATHTFEITVDAVAAASANISSFSTPDITASAIIMPDQTFNETSDNENEMSLPI